MIHRHVTFYGRVQGGGFRYSVRHTAATSGQVILAFVDGCIPSIKVLNHCHPISPSSLNGDLH